MKCSLCSKNMSKSDYWAGIKYSRLMFFIFGYVTDFFLLLYWKMTGAFEKNLDKKTEYMHFSCFKKQSGDKKRYYAQPITYTQYGKKIVYVGFIMYPLLFILCLAILSIKLGIKSKLFFDVAIFFSSLFSLGTIIGISQLFLLDLAARHLKKKLNFN